MLSRREFVHTAGGAAAVTLLGGVMPVAAASQDNSYTPRRGPVCIASANGLNKFGPENLCCVERAVMKMREGLSPVDAAVLGVNIVEDDPRDHSVGYGGLPNEDGVVELDASVMDGPSGKCGSVASIQRIKNPSSVALLVMRRTDHVLLVGDGARRFARAHGFEEIELLTDDARRIWLKWKESHSTGDKWLSDEEQRGGPTSAPASRGAIAVPTRGARHALAAADGHVLPDLPFPPGETPFGTINCLAMDEKGDLGGVTTTSGLAFKLPGRVGDSPIIGAGLYVDNAVGAAGSTGRGEANLQNCSSFLIVEFMRAGQSPEQACLNALRRIAEKCEPRLRDARGEPNFGLTFYAISKDGRVGGANMRGEAKMAFHDGSSARHIAIPGLFENRA